MINENTIRGLICLLGLVIELGLIVMAINIIKKTHNDENNDRSK